jgi:hypothetical protein
MSPAHARLLRAVVLAAMAGMGCCAAALVVLSVFLITGAGAWLTAAHWLNWGLRGCVAAVLLCAALSWRQRRSRGKGRGGNAKTRPR